MELLSQREVEDRLSDIAPFGEEYEALAWLRDVYYLHAEGFIDIEGQRCYPVNLS